MVASSFPWFRQSGRDDPDPRAPLRVDNGKEVVLDHAEQDIAILAVISTPVLTYHGERVIEGQASCLEAYAVISPILGRLGIIPLEIIIFHDTTGYPYHARMEAAGFRHQRECFDPIETHYGGRY